jgi:predicted MPP superfamily phosphohydrolase
MADWQKTGLKSLLSWSFWVLTLLSYTLIVYFLNSFTRDAAKTGDYFPVFMSFGVVLLIMFPKLIVVIFHLMDDITFVFKKVVAYFTQQPKVAGQLAGPAITRWSFISKTGWALAAIPFFSILYGMARGRYNFRVSKTNLSFTNLPKSLSGLKIVHISDLHIGSFFNNYKAVTDGIEKINELEPDLILFTGDMVNNVARELDGWVPHLSKLKAKYGKYSILGNHDYGDYVEWSSGAEKTKNLDQLKALHKEIGFNLLLNERANFSIEEGEEIEILGMENWGQGGFSKYGDLTKTLSGSDSNKFQLLLSHDPSHWDAEVLGKTNIDLTLAGHTHGMQFGIEIPGFLKWSPAKYRYPRWGGLYSEDAQYIYVNRGFGYLGFPGRVGMPPEITEIILHKA